VDAYITELGSMAPANGHGGPESER
jgi:hypothetical protein